MQNMTELMATCQAIRVLNLWLHILQLHLPMLHLTLPPTREVSNDQQVSIFINKKHILSIVFLANFTD